MSGNNIQIDTNIARCPSSPDYGQLKVNLRLTKQIRFMSNNSNRILPIKREKKKKK